MITGGWQESERIGDTKEVLTKLANGGTREIRTDYTTTLLLNTQLTTGFLNRLAGGNATMYGVGVSRGDFWKVFVR